jgi:valyl-tRNA synthetase
MVNSQIERLTGLLATDFATKAPAPVVEKERLKLKEFLETREKLLAQIG